MTLPSFDLQEYLPCQLPTPAWIVQGLMTGGTMLVYGRPKVGKSFLAFQLAAHLCHNKPFLKWPASGKEWRVLYVQVDAPGGTFQDQLRRIVPWANFGLAAFDHPNPKCRIPRYFLSVDGGVQKAKTVIHEYQPAIVIWDGLTHMDYLSDYNDRPAVMAVWKRLRDVWSGPCIVLAHANKSQGQQESRHPIERVAGSQALAAEADCGIHVEEGRWLVWSRSSEDRYYPMTRVPEFSPEGEKTLLGGSWTVPTAKPPIALT